MDIRTTLQGGWQRFRADKKLVAGGIIILILLAGIVYAAQQLQTKTEPAATETPSQQGTVAAVKIMRVAEQAASSTVLSVSGVVKADNKVDVVAMANGTVRSVNASVGDTLVAGTPLVNLHDSTILTTLSNAYTSVANVQQNYAAAQRLADESVRQAEIRVEQARQSVDSATIGLQAAKDNLANAQNLQQTSKSDALQTATIAFAGHINTVTSALDQIDTIIGKDTTQLAGLTPTLAAKDAQILINLENQYDRTREQQRSLGHKEVNDYNILARMNELLALMVETKKTTDLAVATLDATVSNQLLSDPALQALKATFTGLRSSLIGSQTAVQTSYQNLQNIDLIQKRELDGLQNAVKAAQSQVALAQTGYQTALSGLKAAQDGRQQQLISARTALNSAQGQLALVQTQVNDLTVTAPIDGQLTQRLVEVGAEVRAGQKVAEIVKADLVKITVSISVDDASKIAIGERVKINDALDGVITRIDPTADPVTKKVNVEVSADNAQKQLVPETFVNVKVPLQNGATATTVVLPLQAVTITPSESYVFTIRDSRAVKTPVILGQTTGETVEIISGITSQDSVVIEGSKDLTDGTTVNAQ